MIVVRTFEDVCDAASGRVGLVPTMGFLHEGHLSLISAAAAENDSVVVSIFVNPTQFGDPTDLDAYPVNFDRDTELAREAGATIVFAPSVEYMYPFGNRTTVTVAGVSEAMEGSHRPGHFDGVATVVAKLFAGSQPDAAYFGRKDAQQLAVVRSLATDLAFAVDVRGMPVVRESTGLALSSRNVHLDDASRAAAPLIFQGLAAGAARYESGERSPLGIKEIVATTLAGAGDIDVEYVELADSATARPAAAFVGEQFLAVAARLGGVRLIDNITINNDTAEIDTGIRLDQPSILYGGFDAAHH